MLMVMCSVRDAQADVYGRPFFTQSAGVAVRSFADEVNRKDEKNDFYNHPSDFALYDMGTFDDNTGIFFTRDVPKLLVQADQVKVG